MGLGGLEALPDPLLPRRPAAALRRCRGSAPDPVRPARQPRAPTRLLPIPAITSAPDLSLLSPSLLSLLLFPPPQIGLGYLLPTLAFICIDVLARRRYATRRSGSMAPEDGARWVASKTASAFNPWAIMALVYPHLLTALWYALMWGQLDFSRRPAAAAAAAGAGGAALGAAGAGGAAASG